MVTISATEVSTFVFCPRAWYMQRKGVIRSLPTLLRMEKGRKLHDKVSIENAKYKDKTLFSKKYNLKGKPDFIIEDKFGIYPLEFKSSLAPSFPYPSHIAQLICYCILVEENFSKPNFGIIKYVDGHFMIPYTKKAKDQVLHIITTIESYIKLNLIPLPILERKCLACDFLGKCLDCLFSSV